MKKHVLVSTIAIVVIITGTAYAAFYLQKKPQTNFTRVLHADITQAINIDGTVQAAQDLSLSFQQGGVIEEVNVKAGDQVKSGQVLARLNTSDAAVSLGQANASLAVAKANRDKVVSGATGADIDVSRAAVESAQTALDNAQKNLASVTAQQNLLVKNALSTLMNTNLTAVPANINITASNPTVSGVYNGTDQGQYQIKTYNSGNGLRFNVTGLEDFDGLVSTSPTALGSKGLYIQFSSNTYANDTWTVNLPNPQGSSYLTNYNAYQSALQTQTQSIVAAQAAVDSAKAALAQAQANLQLKQTAARPEDIAAADAQVAAAEAQVQSAQNAYAKTVLTAPIDGTVSEVDVKIGQTVAGSTIASGPAAIKMISASKFQIISYLSEADIAKIKPGDQADVTLDAYGSGNKFTAQVLTIDPSATINAGVSTYKTTLQFSQEDDRIKEGMKANIVITDQTHSNALVIPASAVIKKGEQEFVLTRNGKAKTAQTQITTGIADLNGNVEVLSGLSDGEDVAAFGNQQ